MSKTTFWTLLAAGWTMAAMFAAFWLYDTALAALCIAASAISDTQSLKVKLGMHP